MGALQRKKRHELYNKTENIISSVSKRYNLRNVDINITRFHTAHYGKHSFRHFGPHLWNRLDQKLET